MPYYLFESGMPCGQIYHWEKVMFDDEQQALCYLNDYDAGYSGKDWECGPRVTEHLSEYWPTMWNGNETIPVPMYSEKAN